MTAATTPRTPLACLYDWERTRPDTVHFTQPVGGGKVVEYTWGQIMDQVRRMAAHLQSLNLPPQSQIAILGKNSAHWIMTDWAIWMAGHVTVPLYPTLAADTVRYILEHSESKLLFVGKLDGWEAMKPGVPTNLPVITLPLSPKTEGEPWDDIVARTAPLQGHPDRELNEMATIAYTSGSTGQPKGVMQSFNSFYVCGTKMVDIMPSKPDDRMISYLPLAHVAERIVVETQSTYHGFHVFFAESLDTFLADLQRAQPTIFFSVPRLWTKFQLGVESKLPKPRLWTKFQLGVESKLPKKKQKILFRIPILGRKVKRKILQGLGLDHVRIALTGAAPLPPPSIAWYRSLGLELLEAYGMTENMAYSHFTRPNGARIGYVGQANPGVECRIDPETREILVKSPGQMMGYFKEPEKTAECYSADGFFKTGDMGEIDEQGRLRITGRVKELFKTSKGKYVAPVPIENKLGAHPKIEAVCVGGANQQATFALVLLAEDARKTAANDADYKTSLEGELKTLIDEVNAGIDPHEYLAFAVVMKEPWTIDNGALTPTMKIRRNIIEERTAPKIDGWFAARRAVIWE